MDLVGNRNLADILNELATRYNDKIAIEYEAASGDRFSVSYRELESITNRFANFLLKKNVSKGDRVIIHMNNTVESILSLLACAKIGAVAVTLNQHAKENEIEYALKKTTPNVIITQFKNLSLYHDSKITKYEVQDVIITNIDSHNNVVIFGIIDKLMKFNDKLALDYKVTPQDLAEIMFTSGTTSEPKGVMITQYNLIFAGYYTAWQAMITSNDTYLTVMPFCHIDGQCTAFFPTIISGATFVMIEKYSAQRFWGQVIGYKATITELMPKIIYTLMYQDEKSSDSQHNLRLALYYLDIKKEIMDSFCIRYNLNNILTSYGMTETIVGIIGDRLEEKRKFPSIGRVGFCYEAKIINPNGDECEPYEHGQICIKGEVGKTIFQGYYNDLFNTNKTLKEGWIFTGDIGYVDTEGYFYFVDRDVNLIKVSGENVSSVELESFIGAFDNVFEVAAVGVPDDLCETVIKVCIVPRTNCYIDIENIKKVCKDTLPKYKCPTYYEVWNSLPKTKSGKVKKYLLKEIS